MIEHFRTFARYNVWANARLYDAAQSLDDGAYRAPRASAYFGSLHGTLNHILVGDRVWMGRIEGVPSGIEHLDLILHDDLESLRAARAAEDRRIQDRLAVTTDADLSAVLRYCTIVGDMDCATPLSLVWTHVFNHQTHHRGQAHALLKDAGAEPPPLDLIFFLRET